MSLSLGRPSRRRRDDGAAAVEFALVMVPLLVLIFLTIHFGMLFYSTQAASSAAREALRRASVGDCTDAELYAFVDSRLGGAENGNLTVTRTFTTPAGSATSYPGEAGDTVTITVQFDGYNFNYFVPGFDDPVIEREVDARLEDSEPSAGACV